jgi:hypothetical protein
MSTLAHMERPLATQRRRREHLWRLAAVLLLGFIASIGCDPISTMSFLLYPTNENTVKPKMCSLTIPGKESKVLIVAAHDSLLPNQAFRDAHRDISRRLAQILEQRCKDNNENVKIVSVTKILNYMDNHPGWIAESKRELGKRFDADFVVFLDLGEMTMYEPGSHNTLYRGNVEIQLFVYDLNQPEGEEETHQDVFKCIYPISGPTDAGDTSAVYFHMKFMDNIAKGLVQYFASSPSRDVTTSE